MNYQPTIGLEVHIELKTKSKMFCSCLNDSDERHPNLNICEICTAQPGSLPVINKEAVRKTIKTGLALNCQIPEYSKFDRKNYFYPDLPKGYQISQYDKPLCVEGYLEIGGKKIRIRRAHLEEDTGRLIHEKDYSLVDFNRAGIPLMELVTEPDINSAKEARKFAQELHLILHYLDVSDADMEKGQMRVEVNISLIRRESNSQIFANKVEIDSRVLGTKVEIKNLNSFRAVERAIEYEIKRQTELLNRGEKIIQETRGWDDVTGKTVSQREKEEAHDYRYFPEPDLPPLHITLEMVNQIRAEIPELPQQKRERFRNEYGLSCEEIETFIKQRKLANYFEEMVSELKRWCKDKKVSEDQVPQIIKIASNYLQTDLLGILKSKKIKIKDLKVTPENFAELVTILWKGKISSRTGKDILTEMVETGVDPTYIMQDKGLEQISDKSQIEEIAKKVISENQKAIDDYKKGKKNAIQFLIGGIMRETKGRVNPEEAKKVIIDLITN